MPIKSKGAKDRSTKLPQGTSIPEYYETFTQGQYLLYRIPQPAPIAQSDRPLTQRSVDGFWHALRHGGSSPEDLIASFESALPGNVRDEILAEPHLGTAILARFDYRLGDSEASEVIHAVMRAWLKKSEQEQLRARRMQQGEAKRGRRPDPEVKRRRQILRASITNSEEFKDPAKIRNLFGRLERNGVPIPNSRTGSTAWLALLDDPLQVEIRKSALAVLRKDFDRA